jgi:hypothetical protein
VRSRLVPLALSIAAVLGACARSSTSSSPAAPSSSISPELAASGYGTRSLLADLVSLAAGRLHVRGHFQGTQTLTPLPDGPDLFRAAQTATGTIERVGPTTITWAVPTLHIDRGRREVDLLTPNWTLTMTLANGDQGFADYEFRSKKIHYEPSGEYTAVAGLTLTSGTGLLRGATGHGVVVVRGNALTGQFSADLEGQAVLGQQP